MDTTLLELICSKNSISYILFDTAFEVVESFNVSVKKQSDIREYLFEIVGLEESILGGQKIEIPMIVKNQHYYDLSIEPFNEQKNIFIAYMQAKSKETIEYANVLKEINKKTLIFDTSDEKKEGKSFAQINQHLITLHVDLDGIITLVNDAALHFFNLEKSEMKGKHFSTFFTPQSTQKSKSKIFLATNSFGKEIFFHTDFIPLTNTQGRVVENIIIAQDVSYLKEVKEELEYAQEHDTLTGLPNRHYLLNAIDERLQENKEATIVLFDIIDFSKINEEYGSHAADMLLKHITEIITTTLDANDTLTRFVHDKFVILFESDKNRAYIDALLKKVMEAITKRPLLYTHDDHIAPSLLYVLHQAPKDAQNAAKLLEVAKKSMDKKKIAYRKKKIV